MNETKQPVQSHDTILIVEDDASLRRAARRVLAFRGYHVEEAADGKAALQILFERPEDIGLVITDLLMPGMSGVELYQTTRDWKSRPPFLVTTGLGADAARQALGDSDVHVIAKPWMIQDLVDSIEACLTRSRSIPAQGFVVQDGFADLLKGYDMGGLERDHGVIYGVWPDFTLAYVNPAWFGFAEDNGGAAMVSRWTLGSNILEGISAPLVPYFQTAYERSMAENTRWEHRYECSSASRFRYHHQQVYPLSGGGLLIANSQLVSDQISNAPAPQLDLAAYYSDDRIVTQCSHCRRVENRRHEARWDWIPEWVDQFPPMTSHGLCPLCFGHYYPPPSVA